MKSTLRLLPIALLCIFAAQTAVAGCPNSTCGRSCGASAIMPYFKGKTINGSARPTISNVAGNAITLGSKTYQTDGNTLMFVDGKQVNVAQLKAGMKATVKASLLKPTVASSITATTGK